MGTLLILAGFILSQRNLLHADSSIYLVLNLTGATILAVLAFQGQRWGFVLLEGVWALVALAGLRASCRKGADCDAGPTAIVDWECSG